MNSDELNGKTGKVKVMYVRRDDEDGREPKRGGKGARRDERQDARRGKSAGWQGERSPARPRGAPRREGAPWREGSPRREDSSEAPRPRKPRQDAPWQEESTGDHHSAPARDRRGAPEGGFSWQMSSRVRQAAGASEAADPIKDPFDHGGISGNSDIDPEILRRQRAQETRVYGENACLALFARRPDCIVRGWFSEEITPRFRDLLRWLAANRKAYHVVQADELARVSGTDHHGGVCLLIKKRAGVTPENWLASAPAQDCVLALEAVANPHNIGAIMRSCAHFGVRGMLVEDAALLESGAAVRTAEGGAEHVQPIVGDDFISALHQFRHAGYRIVVTSSHKGTPLFSARLPEKMVLVLGQERSGVSASVQALADMRLVISGSGAVESLNVSVAAGVLLSQWYQRQS